jgi:membrane-bound metal-dependent hydrolase YbcI (DUF457 family)
LDYAVNAAYHSLFMTARAGFRHNAISMDNLTHTLIGLVAGDAIARGTADAPGGLSAATRRSYFVTVAAIGSNIPDIDLVLTYGGFAPGKIGYLLHHRGYTHTLIGCVLLALLLHACVEVWARWRKQRLSRADRVGIAGVAVLGSLLHLLMDGMNSYGVHPYWPFENGWVYGDAVFIIEPLIWLSAIPLLFTVKTWLARIVVALAGIAALGIGVYLNREQSLWVAGLVLFAVALVLLGKRCSPRGAALASVAAMTGVTATFFFAGRITEHRVETLAAVTFPGEQTLDHVLTPVPTNPLCWDLLLIQTSGGRYIVRHGVVDGMSERLAGCVDDPRDEAPVRGAHFAQVVETELILRARRRHGLLKQPDVHVSPRLGGALQVAAVEDEVAHHRATAWVRRLPRLRSLLRPPQRHELVQERFLVKLIHAQSSSTIFSICLLSQIAYTNPSRLSSKQHCQ